MIEAISPFNLYYRRKSLILFNIGFTSWVLNKDSIPTCLPLPPFFMFKSWCMRSAAICGSFVGKTHASLEPTKVQQGPFTTWELTFKLYTVHSFSLSFLFSFSFLTWSQRDLSITQCLPADLNKNRTFTALCCSGYIAIFSIPFHLYKYFYF